MSDNRTSTLALLQGVLAAAEVLASGDKPIDTIDVEFLSEAYDRIAEWRGSGSAFPRDVYSERMRIAEEYEMEDEMI